MMNRYLHSLKPPLKDYFSSFCPHWQSTLALLSLHSLHPLCPVHFYFYSFTSCASLCKLTTFWQLSETSKWFMCSSAEAVDFCCSQPQIDGILEKTLEKRNTYSMSAIYFQPHNQYNLSGYNLSSPLLFSPPPLLFAIFIWLPPFSFLVNHLLSSPLLSSPFLSPVSVWLLRPLLHHPHFPP